ncbi:hypothetical protein BCR44DRAFT_1440441 [Catenaria anguillulae PL171]|uniref:Uncharacterized protein n=1 Tax=Catenaria anguillulae PL171 TaxID=765915 RepID=A0A1Y2HEI1_9FUNG|nr:hypothetical protein BCR44DRAFT_1440441 [Catenaria anguillulae PL171]
MKSPVPAQTITTPIRSHPLQRESVSTWAERAVRQPTLAVCASSATPTGGLRPDLRTPTTSADLLQLAGTINLNDSAADLFYSPDAPMTGLAATSTNRTLTPVQRFGSQSRLPSSSSYSPSSSSSSHAATDSDEKPMAPPAIVAHGHGYAAHGHTSVAHTLMEHHQHSPRRSAVTPTMRRSRSGRQQQTVTAHKDKDTRVKLTNHALEVSMAAAAAINDDEARTTLRLSVEAVEEQRAVRKYAEQVLGLTLGGNNDNGNGLNEEPEVGVAMAAELADESSAGRMWDQSGASAYETDYGRDFD